MWSSIIFLLVQVALWVLKKINAKEETTKAFLEFIRLAANDTKSARLMQYWREQKDWLDKNPWPRTASK